MPPAENLTLQSENNYRKHEEKELEVIDEFLSSIDNATTSGISGSDDVFSEDDSPSMVQCLDNDFDYEVDINPQQSPLEGGAPCLFSFSPKLSLDVTSVFATFGNIGTYNLRKVDDDYLCCIPASQEPGLVSITLWSHDNNILGQTEIHYYRRDQTAEEPLKKLVFDPGEQKRFFGTFISPALSGSSGNCQSGTSGVGTQIAGNLGSSQPSHVLSLLIYTAAKYGAQQFIEMIFNSSAGRVVFDAYKDNSTLPESVAKIHGNEKTANFLGEITKRFSEDFRIGQEFSQTVDWSELVKAAEEAQRRLNHSTDKKDTNPVESDLFRENGYSADVESSSESSDRGSSDSEHYIPTTCNKGNNADSFGVYELKLREYQKELAAPALEGKNTIICAPTNSGKTYVAIEIAKKHLESFSADADATGSSSRKEPRVVFIVSTMNLVLQQKERFEAYLGYKYSVGEISGANPTEIPLKYLLQNHEIVVITAKILVNALYSKTREKSVKLDDISLLLFDECHHAHKEHSYNRIMKRYLALKCQPGRQHNLPQVIGFTASLGTGKGKSVEKAAEHILLVSANLDAEVISTVQKNQKELKQYVNVPERKVFHVPTSGHDPFEKIVSQVMDKIENKVKEIKGKSFRCGPPDKASQQYRQWVEEFYKDSIADAERYLITFTEHLREYHIALTINKSTTMKNAKKRLQNYFETLDEEKFLPIDRKLKDLYHCAMKMLDTFVEEHGEPKNPFLMELKKLLLQYMEPQQRREDENQSRQMGNISKKACDQDEERGDENSDSRRSGVTAGNDRKTNEESEEKNGKEGMILENEKRGLAARNADAIGAAVGKDEVENGKSGPAKDSSKQESQPSAEKLQDDKPSDDRNGGQKEWNGPKGILFTRTRESTSALEDWIKETEELNAVLRPEALVSGGDGNIGMTQNEQERVIKRFHTGEKNLLLVTSAAEEGLDIRDCNFVIRYDTMGNEIYTVQSRGRVRAYEGMYSVLVGRDSGALTREYTNQFRESLMIEALIKVQGMDLKVFKQMVKNIQRKNFQDHYLKEHVVAMRKSVYLPDDVTFHCRKCDVKVCQAHDIRRIRESHHVIINSEVRDSKVHIKDHPNPKTIGDIVMNKKIYCKKCYEDWGVTALINGMEWMWIKISSFVLEFPKPNRRRQIFKKWKNLPFEIPAATIEELL